jgi:hypothetical protein
VRVDQLVDERVDLVEVELGSGVRVEHRGVVHVLALPGECGLHRQFLHIDIRADERRELRRECADVRGLHAVAVDEARNLNRGARGQVVDEPLVGHVAVDDARLARLDAADDRRRVLEAALHLDGVAALE